ncbi:MAG TPA: DUF1761 domain-containing protein [Bacteroidia bacterium]|jgi:hypothetical protein|nr:DUF1761 domain-containing protein [Bacteroidia bacterium]
MHINFIAVLIAALVPMVMGFIWYNPKVFGTAWMAATGMTPEKGKQANMPMVFIVSFILSFLLAFAIQFMTIHQYHVGSLFYKLPIDDAATPEGALYKQVMDLLGSSWRTFKHGALHGFIGGVMIALPIIATGSLFEQKGWKYIWINAGYWIVCMTIMGGIVCAMP